MYDDQPVELSINGILDLHQFRPQEFKELVPDYLAECSDVGILEVRVIHSKGIGNCRRTVHAILDRLPEVAEYALAGETMGGWGATVVRLRES